MLAERPWLKLLDLGVYLRVSLSVQDVLKLQGWRQVTLNRLRRIADGRGGFSDIGDQLIQALRLPDRVLADNDLVEVALLLRADAIAEVDIFPRRLLIEDRERRQRLGPHPALESGKRRWRIEQYFDARVAYAS